MNVYAVPQPVAENIVIDPAPKQVVSTGNLIDVDNSWSIVVDREEKDVVNTMRLLANTIGEKTGLLLAIEHSPAVLKKKNIILSTRYSDFCSEKILLFLKQHQSTIGTEGYFLVTTDEKIVVFAHTGKGIFYGVQTLLSLIRADSSRCFIPELTVVDYPVTAVRGIHFCGIDYENIYRQIDRLAALKINMMILGTWDFFYCDELAKRSRLEKIFRYARERYIEPVPEIPGYSHVIPVLTKSPNCGEGLWVQDEQYCFIADIAVAAKKDSHGLKNVLVTETSKIIVKSTDKKNIYREWKDYEVIPFELRYPYRKDAPALVLKRMPGGNIENQQTVIVSYNYGPEEREWSTYCPSENKTYEIMFSVLETVIEIFKPRYINIAHDEIFGMNADSRCRQRKLNNADLLAEDINRLYAYIKDKDSSIQVMMWDDMLDPWHLGGLDGMQVLYGGIKGQTAPAIDKIAKDIIILLWWYEDNDRIGKMEHGPGYFSNKGFRYCVCPWDSKSNIDQWCSILQQSPGCLGMMGTAWRGWTKDRGSIEYCARRAWEGI
ncbi:MAG: family 20 glycosylhydrolase [Ignavibacteriales bacterium]|nr:family 20 glycosylhydrolase [Ignavibacteriales bacterium]